MNNGEVRDGVFYPAVGSRWRLNCRWSNRPYMQYGTWDYLVTKVENDEVYYAETGDAFNYIPAGKAPIKCWQPEGHITTKKHHLWFVPA